MDFKLILLISFDSRCLHFILVNCPVEKFYGPFVCLTKFGSLFPVVFCLLVICVAKSTVDIRNNEHGKLMSIVNQ